MKDGVIIDTLRTDGRSSLELLSFLAALFVRSFQIVVLFIARKVLTSRKFGIATGSSLTSA